MNDTRQTPQGQSQHESHAASQTAERQAAGARNEGQRTAQQAGRAMDDAKHEARDVGNAIAGEAKQLSEDASAAVRDAASQAQAEGMDFLHRRKDQAAEELSHIEQAVRRASDTLREENDTNLAGYTDAIASTISEVSGWLKRKDLSGIVSDAEHLARRRPELFFGGMFISGLAAARFLKASSHHRAGDGRARSQQRSGSSPATKAPTTSGTLPSASTGTAPQHVAAVDPAHR